MNRLFAKLSIFVEYDSRICLLEAISSKIESLQMVTLIVPMVRTKADAVTKKIVIQPLNARTFVKMHQKDLYVTVRCICFWGQMVMGVASSMRASTGVLVRKFVNKLASVISANVAMVTHYSSISSHAVAITQIHLM